MNHSLAIYQHQLRNYEPVHYRKIHECQHLVAGSPAHREAYLKVFGEVLDQQIRVVVESNVYRLETARPVLRLQLRHHLRGMLTMRASRVYQFERDDFAAKLAQKLLALVWHGKG